MRASRENASRNLPGSALGSSIVTFAPLVERLITILDRVQVERNACECYATLVEQEATLT